MSRDTLSKKTRKIQEFQQKIFDWWRNNTRDFPWRRTEDPYLIMVSEFMLQQTQATRVVSKYLAFTEKFPAIKDLAAAQAAEVLVLWSGLGYNRRAIWLQEAAREIDRAGTFPRDPDELKKLKGIGSYTSRSIPVFAFNTNVAAVDTNIRRILIAEGFATEKNTARELLDIATALLPDGRSRDWHNALMDYGSTVKTAKKTGIKPLSKQSKFKGSDRQYRGRIVKYLTENTHVAKEELVKECKIPVERADRILSSLVTDKLIKKEGKQYHI